MTFSVISILVSIVIGLAIDWAFYERTVNVMKQFYKYKISTNYINYLYPRVIITCVACVIIIYGLSSIKNDIYIVLGGVLFLLSNYYAYFRIYCDNKCE